MLRLHFAANLSFGLRINYETATQNPVDLFKVSKCLVYAAFRLIFTESKFILRTRYNAGKESHWQQFASGGKPPKSRTS